MTIDEAHDFVKFLFGQWPHVEVTEWTIKAYAGPLAGYDVPTLWNAAIRCLSDPGRVFAPTTGELIQRYREIRAELARRAPRVEEAPPVKNASEKWAELRKQNPWLNEVLKTEEKEG